MTKIEIIQVGLSILGSLGGAGLLLAVFSSWLGKVWASRILESDRSKYASELEALKAENQNYINVLGITNSTYLESKKAFNSERLASIKILRGEVIRLRDERPSVIIWLDMLAFANMKYLHEKPQFAFARKEDFIKDLSEKVHSEADLVRPFLDDLSFKYFWAYRQLTLGLAQYAHLTAIQGPMKMPWYEDESVLESVKPILSSTELDDFKSEKWQTTVLFNYIEQKLAIHLKDIASGKNDADDSFNNALEWHKSLAKFRELQEKEA